MCCWETLWLIWVWSVWSSCLWREKQSVDTCHHKRRQSIKCHAFTQGFVTTESEQTGFITCTDTSPFALLITIPSMICFFPVHVFILLRNDSLSYDTHWRFSWVSLCHLSFHPPPFYRNLNCDPTEHMKEDFEAHQFCTQTQIHRSISLLLYSHLTLTFYRNTASSSFLLHDVHYILYH